MKIKNAILIHGPGRSGTTLLNSILALHKDLAWISGYTNRYPQKLWLTYFNRVQANPTFEKLTRGKKKFPRPAEAYNFWLHYVPQFNNTKLEKISKDSAEKSIKAISTIIYYSKKKRFLTKITGNSRHQTIDAVFDNPFIIWIDRDPKAVIMSYYKQKWKYKNNPEKFKSVPKKELLLEYFSLYKSFQTEKNHLKRFNLKTFYYEDFISDKFKFFKEICDFSGLNYTPEFEKLIASWEIVSNTNSLYKKYISTEEELYLDELIATL